MACAASSITGMPARPAISRIGSRSALSPKRCTGMMALVRGVIARVTASGSTVYVNGSISTSTGRAPTLATDPAVAKNEYVGVMISSPALTSSAIRARSSASVPDDTAMTCLMPSRALSSASRASISGPMMKRWLSATRVIAARISSRSGRYWACRSSNGTGILDVFPRGPFLGRECILPAGLHRGPRFPVGLTPLDRFALVVLLLALREAHSDLHAAILEIEAKGHERHPLLDRLANELADLLAVQQQLAPADRLVVGVAAMAVGTDVDVVEKYLAVLDAREAVAKVDATFANRLDLGPQEGDAGFECVEHVVVVERLAVFGDRLLLAPGAPPSRPVDPVALGPVRHATP